MDLDFWQGMRLSHYYSDKGQGFGMIAERASARRGWRLALRGGTGGRGTGRQTTAVRFTSRRPSQVRHQRPVDHVHHERLHRAAVDAVVTHENHDRAAELQIYDFTQQAERRSSPSLRIVGPAALAARGGVLSLSTATGRGESGSVVNARRAGRQTERTRCSGAQRRRRPRRGHGDGDTAPVSVR